MARDMEEAEKYLMELEKEITCSICKEHYTQPKALPCLHCYCKHCILKLALRTGKDQPFPCPECRHETTLPEGNEDCLKTAFHINRLKELYAKQGRALSKDHVIAQDKGKVLMESLRPLRKMAANLSCAVEEIQTTESELAPTQLDKPVKVWGGVTKPYGITVNSVGEIIVAEYGGDVVVLDREGKRMRTINHLEHKFQLLRGIAVDSEDNIYFIDGGTNLIFKSNKNCSKVEVHRVQQVKGPGHIDVAVVGDEMMVTEHCNGGRIMVYDRELKYARQIVGADKYTLWGLSSDSHQNVYVSVLDRSSIQVFSNDGAFLRSFGCDEDGVKRLKLSCCACVAGQYVYVADAGGCKIVVFTTEGDYVTSFGDGCYWGVCVDQDGFVYASNYSSNKIDIF